MSNSYIGKKYSEMTEDELMGVYSCSFSSQAIGTVSPSFDEWKKERLE